MGVEAMEVVCWTVTCDQCGENDSTEWDAHFHYASREEAVREVEVAEWKVREDGKVFCFECSEEMVRAGKAVG